MLIRRILILLLLLVSINASAWAAAFPIIVEISDGADIKTVAQALHGKVLDQLPGTGVYLLSVPSLSPTAYLTPGVERIELNTSTALGTPTGGIVGTTGRMVADWYRNQPAFRLIGADQVLSVSSGSGVVIADIDSLVDYSHPALIGHLTGGYDFVSGRPSEATLNQSSASFLDQSSASFLDQSSASFLDQSTASFLDQSTASFLDQSSASFLDATNPAHGHGTLVAGILAAIAPQSMIMPLRVFDDRGQADVFSIAKAIRYAVDHGAHVINMSFGMLEEPVELKKAIEYAIKSGVALVASAGNDNTDRRQFPASSSKVMGIAATTLLDHKASFSNYGSSIDVAAPGVNIISSYPGGYYAVVSGTSFSAPMVAAEAALIQSLYLRNTKPEERIRKGTIKIDDKNADKKLGHGRIHVLYGLTVK